MALNWDNIIITDDENIAESAESTMIFASGVPGQAATIESVTVETLPYASSATVENLGNAHNAQIKFGIPRGVPGNESIDDTAGYGDTDVVWSADKTFTTVTDIQNDLYSALTFLNPEWTPKRLIYYVDGTVKTVSSSNIIASGFLELQDDCEYLAYTRRYVSSPGDAGIAFYDTNQAFVSGIRDGYSASGTAIGNIIVVAKPSNAKYVRFSYALTATVRPFVAFAFTRSYVYENTCSISSIFELFDYLKQIRILPIFANAFSLNPDNGNRVNTHTRYAAEKTKIPSDSTYIAVDKIINSGDMGMFFYSNDGITFDGVMKKPITYKGFKYYAIPEGSDHVAWLINATGNQEDVLAFTINGDIPNLEPDPIPTEEVKMDYIDIKEKLQDGIELKAMDFYDEEKTDSEILDDVFEYVNSMPENIHKTVVIDERDWTISRAMLLTSNTTVVIDGVTVKQADYTFDNVFRGDNLTYDENYPNGFAIDYHEMSNIKIIGKNGAKIEGPDVNAQYTNPVEGLQDMVGDYYGWRTHQINFSAVNGIEISGIAFTKQRGWCISFNHCTDVYVHDLSIINYVKNGDGIDFRKGCHDCVVENISGRTNDDTVACTALFNATADNTGYPKGASVYPGDPMSQIDKDMALRSLDIHDISVNNIFTNGAQHGVICLCGNGIRTYNVFINNVIEENASGRSSLVKVYTGYSSSYTAGDLHDIFINNAVSKGANYVFECNTTVANVFINKLRQLKSSGSLTSISDPTGIVITNS